MPAPAWDKLDAFVNPRDFAVLATVTTQHGETRQILGIYDEDYIGATIGEYTSDSSRPAFHCKAADVIGLAREDVIEIPGEGVFDIMGRPQNDGTGMAVLGLARGTGP